MNDPRAETTTRPAPAQALTAAGGWRTWASRLVLLVFPLVLALIGYYRAQLAGAPLPRPQGDTAFYAYQLKRAAECQGRWWQVAADHRLGHPYPSEFAKHPGLYEGVDLMLLAAPFAGAVSAAWAYHLSALVAILVNGWVAAWIVHRMTRSILWALVAVTLITLNESVAVRLIAHLHLFKFGWVILAVWAFAAFLSRPVWWRGLILGSTVALALQASFYLGFFTGLGLGFWFLIELVAGRVGRNAVTGTMVAAVSFLALSALLCFPVWTNYSPIVGSDQYFHRYWAETWIYGAEVWKYFIPKNSWLAAHYFRDLRHKVPAPLMDEGWNFPGYTVLLAVSVAAVALLRRSEMSKRLHLFVWVSLGLMAFWALLSLAGGPSALIFHIIPSFRCYGRAGLLVVALGSVVAPIVLFEFVKGCRPRRVRVALTLGLLALVASDAGRAAVTFRGWPAESKKPDWVDWLSHQAADMRLAIFMTHPPIPTTLAETTCETEPFYWWGVSSLEWLSLHRHATFSGGSFQLIDADLRLLGASYDQMNPAGLRFVSSLGYETFAVHRDYLAANAWIARVPWLDQIERHGDWLFYQTNDRFIRLPTTSLEELLGRESREPGPREAPSGCWITGSWPVEQETVASGVDWAFLAWSDAHGRPVCAPQPALYQHVFGPSIPAYTIRTPSRPGSYRLSVLDKHHRLRASLGYRIVADLAVSQPAFPPRRPTVTVHPLAIPEGPRSAPASAWEFTLVNTSSVYVQAQVFREHLSGVTQTHPGMRSQWIRASDGGIVLRFSPCAASAGISEVAREILMPQDLPPGGQLKVKVPADRLPASWANLALEIEPSFTGVGQSEVAAERADLKISIDGGSTGIARAPRGADVRDR